MPYSHKAIGYEASHSSEAHRLRAVSATTQQVRATTEGTVVDFELILSAEGLSLSGGQLNIAATGVYSILASLHLDTTSFTGSVETWVESLNPTSGAWEAVEYSGKVKEFDAINEGNVYYNSDGLMLIAGSSLRLKIRASAAGVTLPVLQLQNGTVAPSATLAVSMH